MTKYYRSAVEFAKADPIFASILLSPDPDTAIQKRQTEMWFELTESLTTQAWIDAAVDARHDIFKSPSDYTKNAEEIEEIRKVHRHFRQFREYANFLVGAGERPFTDYLNGISVDDFRELMKNLSGMDSAREIQILYKEGVLDYDLGGSQLHRYMKRLNLPYIPTVNHLNAAKRGEIPRARNR